MIYKLFIFINIIINSSSFILPQIVREWHVVGIDNNIDKSKPYIYNIGKLPMVLWFNNNKEPHATINICKHLGAKLDTGIINNDCLICPNHFTKHNETDAIGNVISKNGLLWWSFKSYKKEPLSIFKKNTTNIHHTYVDINVNLVNVILEFIYSSNKNKNKIKNINNKFFFTEKLYNTDHRFIYKYPYYLKGSINRKINYVINFTPLEEYKTRIYISINNNIDTKIFINYFLNNKLHNLKNYDNNNYLKYLIVLKNEKTNDYMKKIYLLFDKYSFPNEFTISSFYKYRQFY